MKLDEIGTPRLGLFRLRFQTGALHLAISHRSEPRRLQAPVLQRWTSSWLRRREEKRRTPPGMGSLFIVP